MSFRGNRFFSGLVLAGCLLAAGPGDAPQENPDKIAREAAPRFRYVLSEREFADSSLVLLGRRLKQYRKAGDAENARRIFARLFPADKNPDPLAALKITDWPSSCRIAVPGGAGDKAPRAAADVPVFHSAENEKAPSMSIGRGTGGGPLIHLAAERWSGGSPGALIVKKSADLGATWPDAVLLGDRFPWTSPVMCRISKETLGVSFARHWNPEDHDIAFVRLAADLSAETVVPVEFGVLMQAGPAMTSDFPAYASGYIYIVYAERAGPMTHLKFRVSQDLGDSWSPSKTVAAFVSPEGNDGPLSIVFNPDDSSLYVAFAARQGDSDGIAVSRSLNFGASWSPPTFVTPADGIPDRHPRIAAKNRTVIVVYEHAASPADRDIHYVFSSDLGAGWNTGGRLASGESDERFPDVKASEEADSLRIYASYVKDGTQLVVRTCEAPNPDLWTEESGVKADPSVVDDGPVVLLAGDGYVKSGSAAVAWAEKNPDYDVYFNAAWLRTAALATLTVTPGNQNVPYTAGTTTFTVTKTGAGKVDWTAAVIEGGDWLSIQSGASGTNAGTIVAAFTVNPEIATRVGTIRVTADDPTILPIDVTVTQAGAPELAVAPGEGLTSTGEGGGPFTPSSIVYTLQNTGGTALDWTAAKTQEWVTLSAAAGTLAPGAAAAVTVSINDGANVLTPGGYADTVTFTNTTNGRGDATRPVSLTVTLPPGTLAVTPGAGLASSGPAGGPFTPVSASYTLQNIGSTPIDWAAAKTQEWVTLSTTGGALAAGAAATVTVSINDGANVLTPGAYADTATFTNVTNGRGNAIRPVDLTVTPPGVLAVTPAGGLISSGIQGGPFTPSSIVYTLQNTGGTALDWTAAKMQAWVTLSAAAGTLGPGATAAVTVSINTGANALAPGAYADTATFTNTTNGSGTTTRPVDLTVNPPPGALSVAPGGGLVSSGIQGGPFTPSSIVYTLQNTGGAALEWTAAKTQAWVTLSATGGTLAAGASAAVTVSINDGANALTPGAYADTATFTNTTNGSGTTARPVDLTVNPPPGALSAAPGGGLVSSGIQGGPFTPSSIVYTLQNTGGTAVDWTAAKTQAWVTLSAAGGTLVPGATATVTVSINTGANALAPGAHADTVTFTNATNGSGTTARPVDLTVHPTPGVLGVAPAGGLVSSGIRGGPFTPSSIVYTLQNTGGTAVDWTAAKTQAWVTLSAAGGTLAPGATATVTVSINTGANALAPGTHADTATFTNATNGSGTTTRPVSLTVIPPPALSVTPANRDVQATAGTTTFSVANTGGGTMGWTVAVISGGSWLSIQSGSGGTGAGTITAAFVTNFALTARQGIVRVTASGASGSPRDVTVTQAGGYLALSLAGQRLVEKAWIIRREYGKLTMTVDHSPTVQVDKYVIYRKTDGQGYQVLAEPAGSSIQGGQLVYNDTFLETGRSYSYKVAALDSLGVVLRESNEIVI